MASAPEPVTQPRGKSLALPMVFAGVIALVAGAAAWQSGALAAVLGRDAKAPLGSPEGMAEGRFWTGAAAPAPLSDSLAHHVTRCPL